MIASRPTALIADDEPLLRDEMAQMLAQAWPELAIVAQARNGREAVELFESLTPTICFLDVHMPGLSGVEAALRRHADVEEQHVGQQGERLLDGGSPSPTVATTRSSGQALASSAARAAASSGSSSAISARGFIVPEAGARSR